MRVAVTGSSGYIGRALIPDLIAVGHEVIGLDRKASDACELGDAEAVKARMVRFKPDAVIHLAANASVNACQNAPKACLDDNVIATVNVLDAMRGSGCKRIVFASSGAVYGECGSEDGVELRALSWYGMSKVVSEGLIEIERGIECAILRLGNVVGAHNGIHEPLSSGRILPSAVRCAVRGGTFNMFGEGNVRSYVSLCTVVGEFAGAVGSARCGIVDVSEGRCTSEAIIAEVERQLDVKLTIYYQGRNAWEPKQTLLKADPGKPPFNLEWVVSAYIDAVMHTLLT